MSIRLHWILFVLKSDSFVCQQWRQHAFSRWLWGTILKYSSFHKTPFFNLFTSYQLQLLLMITWRQRFNVIPREHQRFLRFKGVNCCLLHFSNHSFILFFQYQYLFIDFIDIKFHCFEIMNMSFNSTQIYSMWNSPQRSWAHEGILPWTI